jgi:hypothetical protein
MKTRRQNRFKKRTAKMSMRGGTITEIKDKHGIYHGEVNAQREKHGKGRMVEHDGYVYEGDWKNNKRDGNGKLIDPDGVVVYEGEFKDDLFHGWGVYNDLSEIGHITYRGAFANNERHGLGWLTTTSKMGQGTIYGEFKHDVPVKCSGKRCFDPLPTERRPTEEGDFENDKLVRGKQYYMDGMVEEGDFENDKLVRGKTTWPDGGVYVGTYNEKGDMDGEGTYVGRGYKYHGEYQNGKMSGNGMLTYPDGTIYAGQFKSDRRNGIGRLTFPDGTTSTGHYKDDKFLKPAPEIFSQQSIFSRELGPAGRVFSINESSRMNKKKKSI